MKTISLCMIVKDEEARLARCLESVSEAVQEIIIVDTGSRDRTVEIAREYNAKILFYEWNGDFAAARNVGLEAASSDYILVLDGDEYLADARTLQEDLSSDAEFFMLPIRNEMDGGHAVSHSAPRMFQNLPSNRFREKIHEFIDVKREATQTGKTLIIHDGYLKSVYKEKDKKNRNLTILKKLVQESPTGYNEYNLARQYKSNGDYEKAADHFERAYPKAKGFTYLPNLLVEYALVLVELKRYEDGILILKSAIGIFPDYTDLHFLLGEMYEKVGYEQDAELCWKKSIQLGPIRPEDYFEYGISIQGTGYYLPIIKIAKLYINQQRYLDAMDVISPLLTDKSHVLDWLVLYLDISEKAHLPREAQLEFVNEVIRPKSGKEALQFIECLFQAKSWMLHYYIDKYQLDVPAFVKFRSLLYKGDYIEARELLKSAKHAATFTDLLVVSLLLGDSTILDEIQGLFNFSKKDWNSLKDIVMGESQPTLTASIEQELLGAGRELVRLGEVSRWRGLSAILTNGGWECRYEVCQLDHIAGENQTVSERLQFYSTQRGVPQKMQVLFSRMLVSKNELHRALEVWKGLREKSYSSYALFLPVIYKMGNSQQYRTVATDFHNDYPLSMWAKAVLRGDSPLGSGK